MSALFQAVPEHSFRGAASPAEDIVDDCFVRTSEALGSSGVASESEILKALTSSREAQVRGEPIDFLETLARIQGHDEERIGAAIMALSDAVASTMSPVMPMIPFASKLIAPSSFYESFEAIHKLGKQLLTPVIFAEDTDAIGTGSVNPIAAQMLGQEIHMAVSKRFGIRPFITCARMEYESWAFLCRKHFEL